MSITRFIGDVAAGVEDLKASISGPGKARRRAEQAAKAKEQRRQAQASFEEGERQRGVKASNDSQIAVDNLGAGLAVANATQGVVNSGKAFDSNLQINQQAATGAQTRQTLGTAADLSIKVGSAKTDDELRTQNNFVDAVAPGVNTAILEPERVQENKQLGMFLGDVPLMERIERMQGADRAADAAMFDRERQGRLPEWLTQAAGLAIGAGSLFMR